MASNEMPGKITAFCKFRIPKDMGIVSIDSDEQEIKNYLHNVVSEFGSWNAEFLSWSEFHGGDSFQKKSLSNETSACTYIEVMTTLDRATLESGDQKEIANKVLEVLQGDNLQVVYSGKSGNESRIGFTQF